MNGLHDIIPRLVTANHILDHQHIVDAFGHISARHPDEPDRYLLSRSLSPGSVTAEDIQCYTLRNDPVAPGPSAYLERFIHGGIYQARPDANAVLHCHAPGLVAVGLVDFRLRPATHMSAAMGVEAPVWDIHSQFGDTNLLVTCNEHADHLAATLGGATVVLMRGHGATFAGADLASVVLTAVYTVVNAQIVLQASGLGAVRYLSSGEVELARNSLLSPNPMKRAWDHFARLAESNRTHNG